MTTKSAAAKVLDAAYSRIEQRQALLDRLAAAKAEYQASCIEHGNLNPQIIEARDQLSEAQSKLRSETTRTGEVPPFLQERVTQLEQRADRLRDRQAELTKRIEALNVEMGDIERVQLPAAESGARLAEVLEQQKRVAATGKAVADIEALIAAQNEVIERARASIPSLDSRSREREDLLAAIAVGKAQTSALDALDEKIAEEKAAAQKAESEAQAIIGVAQATIAGLERRLEEAHEQHQAMHDAQREVLRLFLGSEIDRIGAEYSQAANQLRQCYLQGIGVAYLVKLKFDKEVLLNGWNLLSIPTAFKASVFRDDKGSYGSETELVAAQRLAYSTNGWQEARSAEWVRLKELGLEL